MGLNRKQVEKVRLKLLEILQYIDQFEKKFEKEIQLADPNYRESLRNLLHYLALRNFDLTKLQHQLSILGLSSLGRSEAHVLATFKAVLKQLNKMLDLEKEKLDTNVLSFSKSKKIAKRNKRDIFGRNHRERNINIMVTLPSEAADDYKLVKNLLKSGMDSARINCAHDTSNEWQKMISHIKKGEEELGLKCKVVMDLAGPKIRTGEMEPGPKIYKVKPDKDLKGKISKPVRIIFYKEKSTKPDSNEIKIPVNDFNAELLKPEKKLIVYDARHKRRTLSITSVKNNHFIAETSSTCFFQTGNEIFIKEDKTYKLIAIVGELPPVDLTIPLIAGDQLILHKHIEKGSPATYTKAGKLKMPAHISCTLPEVLDDIKKGERVLLDDGTINGIVEEKNDSELVLRIIYPDQKPRKLGANKGINFPDSNISIQGLTEKDIQDLEFIVANSDVVNASFIRTSEDIENLLKELWRLNAPEHFGIMLKIETQQAFENLPKIIITAMQNYPLAIMIARGDLAIECGWERMAEIQEEILWICEAAHIPDVWATQVLDNLAKTGIPSRAEITDAAMSQRADCVMLNKGPHILKAIKLLNDILIRMNKHQDKKTSKMRPLKVSKLK